MQDFAFLHIKNVHVPSHYVFSLPTCKVQSARSWTFAHARFCILAHRKCINTKTLCFSPPNLMCKVQDFANLHVKDFAFLHIKNVQVPSHSVFSPTRCEVQSARSCTFACGRVCILAHRKCKSTKTCKVQMYKVQDLSNLHMQDFAFLHLKMCKYRVILFFNPLDARCKVNDLAHLHM